MDQHPWRAYWGKARPRSGEGPQWHPLWMHSLDVAAVGVQLMRSHSRVLERVARLCKWPPQALERLLPFLFALHDIGKFARAFQKKAPDCWPRSVLGECDAATLAARDPGHAAVGLSLLLEPRGGLSARTLLGWSGEATELLLTGIVGHHGRPVEPLRLMPDVIRQSERHAASAYLAAVEALLQPIAMPMPRLRDLRRASWVFAGLAVTADWIGSDQRWFPYESPDHDVERYWHELALPRAGRAIEEAGLLPSAPSRAVGFGPLTRLSCDPAPVQRWAENVPLPDGPLLILIEDMTGGGKTEAALVLAHRLLAAGRARGLYVALPTMATANAMFDRVSGLYHRLFAPEAHPTLVLAHGAARLDPRFAMGIRLEDEDAQPAQRRSPADGDSAAESTAWLASETRKALLADIGVGTIDQALLGVLPAKHQALRLLGLSEKILIVDEAHAYDAYMGAELDRLVAFQAALGGHAIILSATLPAVTRARLVKAWRDAAGGTSDPAVGGNGYPLTTLVSSAGSHETAHAPRPDLPRTLRVTRLADVGDAVARIAAAAQCGAAVAWVRNTVDDVFEGANLLAAAGITAQIFHARFAASDRHAIETDIVKRFGKAGDVAARWGRVLVASQVVEQSLDLDFDLVVSDLAPIDLLIQRAGRLWRHMTVRPQETRRVPGPELLVVSPNPDGEIDVDWYRRAFRRAASVYKDHARLWLGARRLFGAPSLRLPEEVRDAIEAVYGPTAALDVPQGLRGSLMTADGRNAAERSFADTNLLKVAAGYCWEGQSWADEAKIMTRLGEEMTTLRLARWTNGRLEPWHRDDDPRRAWALSEVTVREHRITGVPPATGALGAAISALKQWDRVAWGRYDADKPLLPLSPGEPDSWIGTALDGQRRPTTVSYSEQKGLQFANALLL